MVRSLTADDIIQQLQNDKRGFVKNTFSFDSQGTNVELIAEHISLQSGAELSFQTLFKLKSKIEDLSREHHNSQNEIGVLIITGTDALEEAAFALDLLLDVPIPVVITGAMKPADVLGYDGISNIRESIETIKNLWKYKLNYGVLVVIDQQIHAARYVRKEDSQRIPGFRSHPGPVGEIRAGKCVWYFTQLSPLLKYTHLTSTTPLKTRILIWTMCVEAFLPSSMLPELDGIVLCGMGTGSLSQSVVSVLSEWTKTIPVVIVSRCAQGENTDDYYYVGSRQKYEEKGFLISGYEGLNPMQARMKLIFELASKDNDQKSSNSNSS